MLLFFLIKKVVVLLLTIIKYLWILYIIKILISAVIIAVVSEISRKTSFIGGLIASLPLTSILAIIWLYLDNAKTEKIAELSWNIFWFVIPSLLFFILFPILLLKLGFNFYLSLILSSGATAFFYWVFAIILSKYGIKI